ncbi:alpha-amylase [Chryseobacterium sp. SIMBA_038]|uniref:alpha-amylase n=1 Tax=Chryseobacterium sp. SIMBA_038 TaxID=3085780 RepID=UPI003979E52F
MNGVIIQFFHWYHEGNLWNEFVEKADYLKELGFTAVWFPPATKSSDKIEGRGYDIYDPYDLGEFDQKDGIPTRYGTKEEYLQAIEKAHEKGLYVYADIVLNHRIGGDEEEKITVHEVDGENRNEVISEAFEATAKTKFIFPGRKGKYSDFIWDHRCFSGIDTITKDQEEMKGIFKIHNQYGTDWNDAASHQFGNYDYLMGADIEYRNPYVVQEMKNWIRWYFETTKVDGIRLDALKHISSDFLKGWITYIKTEVKQDCYILGEYWKDKIEKITEFSEEMDHQLSLFDVPLHYQFFTASQKGADYDLSSILNDTILKNNPALSVSFVGNHDTQKMQALESAVQNWFRPIAYAIILLSENGYPCVFYPDLFGAEYTDVKDRVKKHIVMPKVEILPKLLEARKRFAYGTQVNYFDHPNCIALVRTGDENHSACAIVISNNGEGYKEINLGKEYAEAVFYDFLKQRIDTVVLDQNGKGTFKVNANSVSVWVKGQ